MNAFEHCYNAHLLVFLDGIIEDLAMVIHEHVRFTKLSKPRPTPLDLGFAVNHWCALGAT